MNPNARSGEVASGKAAGTVELPDLSEARVIAALVLARRVLNNRTSG